MFVLSLSDRRLYKFTTYLGPLKKIAAQISYPGHLPKTAQICAACTANWPMLPKNELQKNIFYMQTAPFIDICGTILSNNKYFQFKNVFLSQYLV